MSRKQPTKKHLKPQPKTKPAKDKKSGGFTHAALWAAIDALATKHGHTASGLARAAGLDATSFNKSKRIAPDGKQRWPSTESLAKIFAVTASTLTDFAALLTPLLKNQPAKTPSANKIGAKKAVVKNKRQPIKQAGKPKPRPKAR